MGLIAWILVGLIAAVIAKALVSRGSGGIGTIILGIVGAVAGGFIASALLGGDPGGALQLSTLVFAMAGAVIVVAARRLVLGTPADEARITRNGLPAESSQSNLLTFISYRREEASGHAGRLYDVLLTRFQPDHVFMDVDAIPPGVDFEEYIQAAVSRCDVLLAIIGPRWLTLTDDMGVRRLDDPGDFVRLEIEAALKRDVRVVPVLIQGSRMPRSDDLPESIRPLARRNALELSDARFRFDAERLIGVLVEIDGAKRPTIVAG